MPDNPAVTMLDLVDVLKRAISTAEADTPSVTIKKASLEIKAQLVEKAGGGFDLTPIKIPIKFGTEIKTTCVQTIQLDFELQPDGDAGLMTEQEKEWLKHGITQAINTVKIAVKDAKRSVALEGAGLPRLNFSGAVVTLNFILDQEGHISFLGFGEMLGFSDSQANQYVNTIKLTLGNR